VFEARRITLLALCVGCTLASHAQQSTSGARGMRGASSQPALPARGIPLITQAGLQFRDLDRNGKVDPYEDWRLGAPERARDLVARMTLAEKAGAMMHGTAPTAGGAASTPDSGYDVAAIEPLILQSNVTAFITRLSLAGARFADENNRLQAIAERGRLGIPILISSDPRNHFDSTLGASVAANAFSQWPQPLGLASIGDADLTRRFADIARQEYRAVGIHMALSPQADLATEPRWPRIDGTFGEDPDLVSRMVAAYVAGFQGSESGVTTTGVATIVKHWVGYGASQEGFDGHNYYGRFSSFPGKRFDDHVRPFDAAFRVHAAGVMPTYNVLVGASINGQPLEQVGAGFNRQLLTQLLREQHGFTGVVLSDWAITNDCDTSCRIGTPQQSPASIGMPWGVEQATKVERFAKGVNAGLDQFGGTTEAALLIEAVRSGRVTEGRLDESVRRIVELKFRLGLFENPYGDPAAAAKVVGAREFQDAALDAQRRSLVLLENSRGLLPLARTARKIYAQGLDSKALAAYGLTSVDDPAQADVAIIRVYAPHQMLHAGFFFGSRQREGSLAFEPGSPDYELIKATASKVPTVVIVRLDRPAILTNIKDAAGALLGEFGASDRAVLDVLTGKAQSRGKLPFELPASMRDVEAQLPDTPHDLQKPLYPIRSGN
jgi:beta-glucosidase